MQCQLQIISSRVYLGRKEGMETKIEHLAQIGFLCFMPIHVYCHKLQVTLRLISYVRISHKYNVR